jgi:hypothetical protein
VLFAISWLGKNERRPGYNLEVLVYWWRCLLPMLMDVVGRGDNGDLFALFFSLRSGAFNDLATPDALFGLIRAFLDRIDKGLDERTLDLDATRPEAGQHHSLREIADYAAETIDTLRRDGGLVHDVDKELAFQLLDRMAKDPIRSSNASETRHRLQED